eukprot:480717-Hanusia_phi.AAC.1
MAPARIAIYCRKMEEDREVFRDDPECFSPARPAGHCKVAEDSSSSSDEQEEFQQGKLKVYSASKHANFSKTSSMVRREYNREIGAMIQLELSKEALMNS